MVILLNDISPSELRSYGSTCEVFLSFNSMVILTDLPMMSAFLVVSF